MELENQNVILCSRCGAQHVQPDGFLLTLCAKCRDAIKTKSLIELQAEGRVARSLKPILPIVVITAEDFKSVGQRMAAMLKEADDLGARIKAAEPKTWTDIDMRNCWEAACHGNNNFTDWLQIQKERREV